MGWVQFLLTEPADGPQRREIDLMPMQYGTDWPFLAFGESPSFFDAPANPERPDEDWTAFAFLAVCTGVVFHRRLTPLLGFRWGYQLRFGHATPTALEPVGAALAVDFQPELVAECQTWTIAVPVE
jgi:hypothetical protein